MTSILKSSENTNNFLSFFINNNQSLFSDISTFFRTTKYLNFKNIKVLFENNLAKKINKKYNYLIGFNTETNKINLINTKNGSVVTIDYNFTECFKNKEFQITKISILNDKVLINDSQFILKEEKKSLIIDFNYKNIYFINNKNTHIIYDEYAFYFSNMGSGMRTALPLQSMYVATPASRNTINEDSSEQLFIKEHFLDICACLLTKNKEKLEDIININNLIYDSNHILDYINESFFEIVKWDS